MEVHPTEEAVERTFRGFEERTFMQRGVADFMSDEGHWSRKHCRESLSVNMGENIASGRNTKKPYRIREDNV